MNTGTSLAGICGALDALGDTISSQADKYHCCANQVNNKMFCFKTAVASGVGITTTNPGVCLDTDAICTGDWYRTLSRQIISYVLIILPLYTWNRKQLSFYDRCRFKNATVHRSWKNHFKGLFSIYIKDWFTHFIRTLNYFRNM